VSPGRHRGAVGTVAAVLAGVLSVVAAALYTVGLALQQQADDTIGAHDAGRLATVRAIVRQPTWLAGFGMTVSGFVLHGVALSFGSLTLVQILQTTEIAFVVPIGARVARTPIRSRDWLGAALVVGGLVVLLLAVRPTEDTGAGTPDGWALVITGGAVLVGLTFALAHALPTMRATLLGLAAGLVFGIEGATLKIASDELADHPSLLHLVAPAVWATFALGAVGIVIQNMALRAGRLSVALSTMTIATPVSSTVVGCALFGENLELSPGTIATATIAGLVAGLGVVLLARSVAASSAASPEGLVATVGA
jgi:drug/metabolite transporter (DMT)-like permease